ncbi:hypothetical protein C2845_PM11G20400 [Panicum miliaceum]|uniref:Uncharacterized protein n=1 Tax=Panicum miliaceum TaxID=4540 RepID=A0A3L6RRU5_PANMI|nr:hypothetical protein C2845_PM11G20400 [Panicum miliaceum]
MMPPTTTSSELLQAQAELWCHTFAYLRSMALQSVIKIGIPTAIHRCGGAASLSDRLSRPSKLHGYGYIYQYRVRYGYVDTALS